MKNNLHSRRLDQSATNRHERLRAQIEQEIIDGNLRPGDRLDEKALAARFGVSRTPVREALLQLSTIGWIRLRPRRSAIVTAMSVRELISMWEVLAELEGLAARLSARRMSVKERSKLKQLCESARAAVARQDARAYEREDQRFHDAIDAAAHSEYLVKQCHQILRRMGTDAHRRDAFRQPGHMETSFKEHLLILDAIVAGDGALADDLMQAHVTRGGRDFFDVLARMHDRPEDP